MENIEDRVYTTEQVAKICRVSSRTVSGWFYKGLIKGYKIPPKRKELRIIHKDLVEFMNEYRIPLSLLEDYLGINL